MSNHKTSLYLTTEEKRFLDANCISLTKFVRSTIQKAKEERQVLS